MQYTRRRIERDLHDGAQPRLISLGLELRTAESSVPSDLGALKAQISHTVQSLVGVSADLQRSHGGFIRRSCRKEDLTRRSKSLARRSAVPVNLDLDLDQRVPESAEVATYYVVAEVLTNAASRPKHPK